MNGSEFFEPFILEAGKALRVNPQSSVGGELELQVVGGGPVFMWRGEKTDETAYAASHDTNFVDFDLAAAVGGNAKIGIESSIGTLTLFSDSDSVGYLRFVPCR